VLFLRLRRRVVLDPNETSTEHFPGRVLVYQPISRNFFALDYCRSSPYRNVVWDLLRLHFSSSDTSIVCVVVTSLSFFFSPDGAMRITEKNKMNTSAVTKVNVQNLYSPRNRIGSSGHQQDTSIGQQKLDTVGRDGLFFLRPAAAVYYYGSHRRCRKRFHYFSLVCIFTAKVEVC